MKIIQKKLPSGLRVVMVPHAEAPTATVLVFVGTGSKHESKPESGLSHFLEHMYFKGTTLRPSARAILEELDSLGAVSNAFTSSEYTGYYTKGNPKHIETFIEILSDIYLHSTFPEKEIEKEKGVIIEEINMYEDMPHDKVWKVLFAAMYGDQPAAWPITGSKENVLGFSRKDFLRYQKQHYAASNTVVVVAGSFDPAAVQQAVKTSFAAISREIPKKAKKVIDTQAEAKVAIHTKTTDQMHIVLAFRSIALGHPDRAAVSLLSTILGGGMSSRLFLELREERGAAYYVRAEQDSYIDHGMFAISAGIDKSRYEEIMESIVTVLKEMKDTPVSAAELAKVKEYTLGMMRLGLESSDSIAGFYGTQLLLKGGYQTPEQLTKEYMKVTAADIQRVAKKILDSRKATLAVVGPIQRESVSTEVLKKL